MLTAGDEVAHDGGAGGRRAAGQAEGRGGDDAQGFVEAGAQVREVADFVVGRDDFGGGEDGVDFGAEFGEAGRVAEKLEEGVVHCYGGCVGASIH